MAWFAGVDMEFNVGKFKSMGFYDRGLFFEVTGTTPDKRWPDPADAVTCVASQHSHTQ